MTPQIYIGLPDLNKASYLNRSHLDIIDIVCESLKVSLIDLNSKSRVGRLVKARAITAYFLRKRTVLPLGSIGALLGDRHHATVMYLIDQVENRSYDTSLLEMFKIVEKNIIKMSDNNDNQ